MRAADDEFTRSTQEAALARQKHRCALCGTPIKKLGEGGRASHEYGEIAHAHHIRHVKFGGRNDLNNCAIICQACHYSAHEGGNYRFGKVIGAVSDYPWYFGRKQ
jgi:5-methylcytosine-specific restriction endonuclease McrA